MSKSEGGVPWPVWALVTILVALIGAFTAWSSRPTNTASSGQTVDPIEGNYLMDRQRDRRVSIISIGVNRYRLEENSAVYPWIGVATVHGSQLAGDAHFPRSSATMRVVGSVGQDRSISVEYRFIRKADGSDGAGVVHRHVWYRE